ncbi:putative membrane protein [Rhizobium paknamense]|uniref:Membrane protein n=2 Tax=Rhizobium paknamense TaxID=1206817 RepID=A0ABU0IEL4_9HYPH|nr:YMGG-like glycine zipper-containing protein [Rhizobium paknamense]MDQ0456677.1 putative membrane protein [Rhizobium paknamense]
MKMKAVAVALILPLVASCTATERGASIGAASGAVIGGVATNSWGGAAVGAVGGGVVGALIGRSTERRGYCIYRDRYGHRYEARCR